MAGKEGCLWSGDIGLKTTFCNKVRQEGFMLCPKHVLMTAERAHSDARRAEATARDRKRKQERLEALAGSPLAAVNPRYEPSGRRAR